jgi:TrmH family RNA methyltransferase
MISSRHNSLVKKFRLVRDGRDRSFVFLEGFRLIEDALRSSVTFDSVLVSNRLVEDPRATELIARFSQLQVRAEVVEPEVIQYVSDVDTPQGIIALAARPSWSVDDAIRSDAPLVLLVEGLRDPGNLGTIVRSAEAFGATGVMTTRGTVDPFSTKVVRASMGSALRLPIVERIELERAVKNIHEAGLTIVATSTRASRTVTEENLARPAAILIGSEAHGLSEEAAALADTRVRIPLIGPVESLNAAIAATILLYEAARQRGFH